MVVAQRSARAAKVSGVSQLMVSDDRTTLGTSAIDQLIKVVEDSAASANGGQVSLGTLVDRFGDRGFGLLALGLGIPCLVPGLPGAQILAVILAVLALQMMMGRQTPWLPRWLRQRTRSVGSLARVASFSGQRLRWIERLVKPRFSGLVGNLGERLAGGALVVAAVAIAMPITNTVPSLGVVLIAVGLLEKDGAALVLGAIIAVLWTLVLGIGAILIANGLASEAPWLPLSA